MSQTDAIFRLISLLQTIPRSPAYRSTTTLLSFMEEQGFMMSMRMLQRDLEKLSAYFPIVCNKSEKPYQWSFVSEYKSNLPALDSITALSWVLAEENLKPMLPSIAFDKLQPQFQQAKAFLDGQKLNRYKHWRDQIKTIPNGKALIPANISNTIWQNVTEGLLMGKILKIEYMSRKKNDKRSFILHPLGLVVRHSTIYLIAMVNDYEDVRQFALQRFISAKVIEQECRLLASFCLNDYIHSGAFGYPINEKNITLKALIEKDTAWHLLETPVSEQQSLEKTESPEKMLLTAVVPNDQQTQWWLMGFGSKIEVLEPIEWRQSIYQHAKAIIERH